ncbi:hypothetical protein LXL04_003252 [Taraxacum kok-saghyz]
MSSSSNGNRSVVMLEKGGWDQGLHVTLKILQESGLLGVLKILEGDSSTALIFGEEFEDYVEQPSVEAETLERPVKGEKEEEGYPTFFTIELHHGGKFTKFPRIIYNEVKTDHMDLVDMDELSVHELDNMLLQLSYEAESIIYYQFLLPTHEDLDFGLRALGNDADVMNLAQYIEQHKVIKVYTEHETTNLLDYKKDKRLKLDKRSSSYSKRLCFDLEENNTGHPIDVEDVGVEENRNEEIPVRVEENRNKEISTAVEHDNTNAEQWEIFEDLYPIDVASDLLFDVENIDPFFGEELSFAANDGSMEQGYPQNKGQVENEYFSVHEGRSEGEVEGRSEVDTDGSEEESDYLVDEEKYKHKLRDDDIEYRIGGHTESRKLFKRSTVGMNKDEIDAMLRFSY